jgi:hypothetical protein
MCEVLSNWSTFNTSLTHQPIVQLCVLARTLHSHNLHTLESALWACTVEHAKHVGVGMDPALYAVLMDMADRGWEEMVGSWVCRTMAST